MAIQYCLELFNSQQDIQGVLVTFNRAEDRLHFLKTINKMSNAAHIKLFSAEDGKPILTSIKERDFEK